MQDRWLTDYQPSERWSHYTRANAGEVMPSPSRSLARKSCQSAVAWSDCGTVGAPTSASGAPCSAVDAQRVC